ncbi:hypothetical protein [Runella sp.]|uniref:hypothetical protein n=1 Tax=Runella sp. TaxID=1960881 RepID=UPI003D11DEC9
MKKTFLSMAAALSAVVLVAYTNRSASVLSGFETGTPEVKSISALAFGPEGVLFIGDSKSASVFAIDTKDAEKLESAKAVEIKNIDQKIAALLGTEAKNITIQDLAVNPISKKVYCAVQSGSGAPVLFKIDGETIQPVSLKDIKFSLASLNNAPAEDAKDQRGRPMRVWAISDLNYADGKLMVSGLSNQEFGSTFRSIPFPFTNKQDQSSLEIYHAAHGQYETNSPIKTFTTAELNGKKFLVASYTCTPLVLFPIDDLKPGTHVKGRTVGEFGAGNSPLDIITMKKGNDLFLIMANSDRPVMKVKYKDIESYQGSLTEPIKENFSTAGVPYVSFPMVNVLQLDKLDETQFVFLQRRANGDLDIRTSNNRAL